MRTRETPRDADYAPARELVRSQPPLELWVGHLRSGRTLSQFELRHQLGEHPPDLMEILDCVRTDPTKKQWK